MPLPDDICERCGLTAWQHLKLVFPQADLANYEMPKQPTGKKRYIEDCEFFALPVSPTPEVHQDGDEERSFTD